MSRPPSSLGYDPNIMQTPPGPDGFVFQLSMAQVSWPMQRMTLNNASESVDLFRNALRGGSRPIRRGPGGVGMGVLCAGSQEGFGQSIVPLDVVDSGISNWIWNRLHCELSRGESLMHEEGGYR